MDLKAPPIDGRANARLIGWLAGEFGVTRRAVRLLRGESGRMKNVGIDAPARMPSWFSPLASQSGARR